MTNITYFCAQNEISMEISGHSGYAEAGYDIVCAAISILIQTLMEYLENNADHCKSSKMPGLATIHAEGGDTRVAFDTIMTGFNMLEDQYPDYIHIEKGCTFFDN